MLRLDSLARKIPSRIILTNGFSDQARICCPICGCKQVHMTATGSYDGVFDVSLCAELRLIQKPPRHPDFPGSTSCTHFFCERGHEFRYLFRFSNRSTELITMASEFDPQEGFPHELWGG